MDRMPASEARADLAEVINRVAYGGERIVLQRRNRDVAALVSLEDLLVLKALEDKFDLEPVRAIVQRAKSIDDVSHVELIQALDPIVHARAGHA